MSLLTEVATWDELRVRAEIQRSTPSGWRFVFTPQEGYWSAAFYEGDSTVAAWESDNAACNVLLVEAYAWLWLRSHPEKKVGPWVRRHDVVPLPQPKSVRFPDPADLDPEELAAVYCRHERKT